MKKGRVIWLLTAPFLLCSFALWARGPSEPEVIAGPEGAVKVGKFSEAPILAELVKKGELPPIEQRIPSDPSVIAPLEEIGRYGGTIRVFHTGPGPWQDFGDMTERGPSMLRIDPSGQVIGDMAESYEISSDYMNITIYLREGLKWSDGEPFTADDIVFTWNSMVNRPPLTMWNFLGPVEEAVKIDDYAFRLNFKEPNPDANYKLCGPAGGGWAFFQPFHYLRKWHIDYNPDAEKIAKDEGFDTWDQALYSHYWWSPLKDLELPLMQPWVMTQSTSALKVYERNPYYHAVDTAGNQYPYIDQVVAQIVDPEVYKIKIISGESDAAFTFTSFSDYTLFKENEKSGNYTVTSIPGLFGAEVAMPLNFTHPDPVKNKLFNDLKFRQALSVAIDREEMNKIIYLGQAVPRQVTVLPNVSYFKKEWAEMYAKYDPAQANKLLDEVGLNKKDKDGFRLRSDGKILEMIVEFNAAEVGSGLGQSMELVKEYWEAAGVKTIIKPQEGALLNERRGSDSMDMNVRVVDGMTEFRNNAISLGWNSTAWSRWIGAKRQIDLGQRTLADFEGGVLPGTEPPQWAKDYWSWTFERSILPMSSKEYRDLSIKLFDTAAKNLFTIGFVGLAPTLFVAKNTLGNVPKDYHAYATWSGDLNKLDYQIYIKQ